MSTVWQGFPMPVGMRSPCVRRQSTAFPTSSRLERGIGPQRKPANNNKGSRCKASEIAICTVGKSMGQLPRWPRPSPQQTPRARQFSRLYLQVARVCRACKRPGEGSERLAIGRASSCCIRPFTSVCGRRRDACGTFRRRILPTCGHRRWTIRAAKGNRFVACPCSGLYLHMPPRPGAGDRSGACSAPCGRAAR